MYLTRQNWLCCRVFCCALSRHLTQTVHVYDKAELALLQGFLLCIVDTSPKLCMCLTRQKWLCCRVFCCALSSHLTQTVCVFDKAEMALLQDFLLCIVKSSHPNCVCSTRQKWLCCRVFHCALSNHLTQTVCVFDKAEMALLQGFLLFIVKSSHPNCVCLTRQKWLCCRVFCCALSSHLTQTVCLTRQKWLCCRVICCALMIWWRLTVETTRASSRHPGPTLPGPTESMLLQVGFKVYSPIKVRVLNHEVLFTTGGIKGVFSNQTHHA